MARYRIVRLEYHNHESFTVERENWFKRWVKVHKHFAGNGEIFSVPATFETYQEAVDFIRSRADPKRTVLGGMEIDES